MSWGQSCAHPNYAGVYTRVAHYVDWIKNPTTEKPTEPTTWYPTDYPTSPVVSTESPLVCYEKGECLYSNLVDVTYPSSVEECLQHCRRTERCQWFTYKFFESCELFESCEYLSDNECNNCITGQVTCPDQP